MRMQPSILCGCILLLHLWFLTEPVNLPTRSHYLGAIWGESAASEDEIIYSGANDVRVDFTFTSNQQISSHS